jgi:hypothetical protein
VYYEDPLFADIASLDYSVNAGSLALNGGEVSVVTTDKDVAGNDRIYGAEVDMGAFESIACGQAHDRCEYALELLMDGEPISENNTCATTIGEIAPSCATGIGNTVWYSFIAPESGTVQIETSNLELISANFNTRHTIYSGTCGSLVEIGCTNENGSGLGETTDLSGLVAGDMYWVRVSGLLSQFSEYLISVTDIGDCPGDFDGNGAVNVADLLIMTAAIGCTSGCGEQDLDGNGAVNIADLLLFTSVFGTLCD